MIAEKFISNLVAAPKVIRKQSDDLIERMALLRRFGPVPTIAELDKHAEKFGTMLVVDTAVELGHSFNACVRLQDSCDRYDASADRKFKFKKLRAKGTSETRVRLLMGIEEEEVLVEN